MSQMKKTTKTRLIVVGIVLVSLVLGLFDFPLVWDKSVDWVNAKIGTDFAHFKNMPFRLGLDLQGGTQLLYEADTSKITGDKGEALEGVRDVI